MKQSPTSPPSLSLTLSLTHRLTPTKHCISSHTHSRMRTQTIDSHQLTGQSYATDPPSLSPRSVNFSARFNTKGIAHISLSFTHVVLDHLVQVGGNYVMRRDGEGVVLMPQ